MENKLVYEFQEFRLEARERRLLRDGKQLDLTPKAFDTLLALAEQGGRLLTKQELMERVWPDLHVDEHNLRVTIAMLRKVLGQDRDGNQLIETVPQKGYRFLASVHINRSVEPAAVPEPSKSGKSSEEIDASLGRPADLAQKSEHTGGVNRVIRANRWVLLVASSCLLGLGGITGVLLVHWRESVAIRPFRLMKLTDDRRVKENLRTDGKTLYFNEFEVNRAILVSAPIGGGPIRPIGTPFSNVGLQDISNDGRNLLVTSFEGIEDERPLWIIPTQGGLPRRVSDLLCHFAQWSPDDRRIACISGMRIIVLDSDGFASHIVGSFSSVPVRSVWSPDGQRLRVVLSDNTARTLTAWEIAISKEGSGALPAASQLPFGNCCGDWAWTQNGRNFVYLRSDAAGRTGLFLKRQSGWLTGWFGREAELPVKIGNVEALTPGRASDALYLLIDNALPENTYRAELVKLNAKQDAFQPVLRGLSACYLSFSRDGQWMTYVNTLDTSLWRSRADGTEALQLTKPPLEVQMSAWSPDGRRIAFMGKQPGKPWRIFLIGRDGGVPGEAAVGNDNQGAPTWSPDGKALAYGNVVCQETQTCWIRRLDLATREVEMLPNSHGFRTARWSPDGKYIAALQPETHELMLFDMKTRRWTTLADSITGDNLNWSTDSQFIYADSPHGERPVIERVRVRDGQRATVAGLAPLQEVPGRLGAWFGLAPDNSPILMHQFTAREVYALEWTDH